MGRYYHLLLIQRAEEHEYTADSFETAAQGAKRRGLEADYRRTMKRVERYRRKAAELRTQAAYRIKAIERKQQASGALDS